MTYQDVATAINQALTGRPENQKVQVKEHEMIEIMILDYIQHFIESMPELNIREVHAVVVADTSTNLVWSIGFPDNNYTFTINGFDSLGNPVEIYLQQKRPDKLIVKTLVNCTLYAISLPFYNANKSSHL